MKLQVLEEARSMTDRKSIFFYYKPDDKLNENLELLFDLATNNGFKIVNDAKEANIIISIGGDGALLQAVRKTGFRLDGLYSGITRGDEPGNLCAFAFVMFE